MSIPALSAYLRAMLSPHRAQAHEQGALSMRTRLNHMHTHSFYTRRREWSNPRRRAQPADVSCTHSTCTRRMYTS